MNEAAVIAALGLAGPLELYALMRNARFPTPLTPRFRPGRAGPEATFAVPDGNATLGAGGRRGKQY